MAKIGTGDIERLKPHDMKFPELSEEDIKEIRRRMNDRREYSLRLAREAAAQAEQDRKKAFIGSRTILAGPDIETGTRLDSITVDKLASDGPEVIRTTMLQLKTGWSPCGSCGYQGCSSCQNIGEDMERPPCCDCSPSGKCGKSYYEPAAFCSHCGRPLTEEAWAALEKILKGAGRA